MVSSISGKGDCWDIAPTESLWGRLKVGRLHGRRFATRRQAMDEFMIGSPSTIKEDCTQRWATPAQ